mgnify:CR=1 FL=1
MFSQQGGDVQPVVLDAVVVIDSLSFRTNILVALQNIDTDGDLILSVSSDQLNDGVLDIETGVGSQDLGDDQEGFSEGFETELFFSSDGVLVFRQSRVGGNFEGTGTGDNTVIIINVLDRSKTVSDGILLRI